MTDDETNRGCPLSPPWGAGRGGEQRGETLVWLNQRLICIFSRCETTSVVKGDAGYGNAAGMSRLQGRSVHMTRLALICTPCIDNRQSYTRDNVRPERRWIRYAVQVDLLQRPMDRREIRRSQTHTDKQSG